MLKRLKAGKSGEGYIDVVVLILCAMLVIGFAVKVLPVFIAKHNLDNDGGNQVVEDNSIYENGNKIGSMG